MPTVSLSPQQVAEALPRISSGLAKYVWLQAELRSRDVAMDVEYQKRFGGFYRVRRNATWRAVFFQLLERAKATPVSFADTLRAIHQSTGRVEASFASKLVATVEPDQPVIDSVVLDNLGLRLPTAASTNRFDEIGDMHRRLAASYSTYLASESGRKLVQQFQQAFPNAHVSENKMLDLVLWQSR